MVLSAVWAIAVGLMFYDEIRSPYLTEMNYLYVAGPGASESSNRSTVKGVSARPSSFLSILVRPNAGYRVVYAVDAMIAAG